MPAQSLPHKMKLRPGHRAAVIAAPSGYLKELAPLPDEVEWITLISVNETWSAFGLRPYRSGEA